MNGSPAGYQSVEKQADSFWPWMAAMNGWRKS
jgi:hypothetical protein